MEYQIIYSGRKTLAVQLREDGSVVARAPYGLPEKRIRKFVEEKEGWIRKKQAEMKDRQKNVRRLCFTPEQRWEYAQKAGETITARVSYYAARMGVSYGKITIREQKTRWGSCSSAGSLNFNWKLILMPKEVLDYVVVHELAHRREMNHSKAFYAVVEAVMPDYKVWQRWLRAHEGEYLT